MTVILFFMTQRLLCLANKTKFKKQKKILFNQEKK